MIAAEHLARFIEDFGMPFLSGQRLIVGDFLGDEGLRAVRFGLGFDAEMEAVWERQLTIGAQLTEVAPAPFDEDAGTLLGAAHELYAACHPQAQAFYARTHRFCDAAREAVLGLRRTYDPSRLVTRHLMVAPVFASTRTDAHVRWWSGGATYYGEDPPARLLRLPSLRRVVVERRTTPMWQIAMADGDEETRRARIALMRALFDVSPLTRLLLLGDPAQKQLGFSLMLPLHMRGRRMSPLFVLDDRRLARAVTDALVERGLDAVGPMVALALVSGVREGHPPIILRRALELSVHLVLLLCLAEGERPGASTALPLRRLLAEDVEGLEEAMRLYWAVVRAAFRLDGRCLQLPAHDTLPPSAQGPWRELSQRLSHRQLAQVADPLARELERRMPAEDVASPPG